MLQWFFPMGLSCSGLSGLLLCRAGLLRAESIHDIREPLTEELCRNFSYLKAKAFL